MADTREKLIELLGGDMCKGCYCEDCEHENNENACIEHIKSKMADHLIANGVTVQQWIPVTERLPDYGQQVIVYLGNLLSKQVMAYQFWSEDFSTWAFVTHWMPLPSTEGLE